MKLPHHPCSLLAAAFLCATALQCSAQFTQPYTNTFDTSNSVVGWEYLYGALPSYLQMSWDPTMDAGTNPSSGSLKVSIPWNGSASYEYWFGYWNMDSPVTERVVDMLGAYVTNISMDIHVDPGSPTNPSGNFGSLQIGFNPNLFWSGSTVTLPLSATNGWMHVSIPVPANTDTNYVKGLTMDMNTPSGAPLNSTTLFWIDNVRAAATLNYTNAFNEASSAYGADVGSSATSWVYLQGVNPANAAMSWSSNVDAKANTNSGSLIVSIPWTNGNSSGNNLSQTMGGTFANRYAFDNGQTTSGSNFQTLYCSVLVSASSPMNAAGNYGVLQIGFLTDSNGAWSGITWPASAVTLEPNASGAWTNIVVPINQSAPGLSNVSGIFLEMQTGAAEGGGLPGTTLLWVDNLGASTGVPVAPTAPSFTSVSQSPTNVVLNGTDPGASPGLNYVMLRSTNLALPMSQWTPIATNAFNTNGTFSYTNLIDPSQPATYFSFTMNVAVTVQANPSGASFYVDGTNFATAQTFSWIPGSSHTISTSASQSGATGVMYFWNGWSDGGAISHVIAPGSSTTYAVNFTTQYYLTMIAGTGGTASPVSAWENSGAVVPISATANGGYFFSNWAGSGSGSYSGMVDATSVTMNGAITETANFTTNVPANISVSVQANPAGASFTVDGTNYTGSQVFSWIPTSVHTIATTTPQSGGAGTQYLWSNWSDGGALSHTVNPLIGTTYTANFSTQYYLTMSAGTGGNVSPASGWENSGAVFAISNTPNGGYLFNTWTGSGSGSYSGSSPSPSVTMNGPISETSSFTLTSVAASSFTMNSNIGVAPFTVTFTDTSLNSPTNWYWTFGDGSTSTNQNPSYTFTNMWRQAVTLAVTNASGGSVSSQAVYQCFPCDALYDWTGAPGQVANVASLSNSLVKGGNNIGYFTTTNHDTPSTNLLGMIFTNLPGTTNGCPVVFSNGTIYSNFNTTNALAYSFTNDHEQFDFIFNSSLHVTNFVWIYYETMPPVWYPAAADEWGISSVEDNYDIGSFWLNRGFGQDGPIYPGNKNMYHTTEADSGYSDTAPIWLMPDRLYRITLQLNTNGASQFAMFDTVSNILVGFVTNMSSNRVGIDIGGFCDGHVSQEILVTNTTCIMGFHDIFSINRPLTLTQLTNVAIFGP